MDETHRLYEFDDIPARFVQEIKDLQAMCWPARKMQDVLPLLGVITAVHTKNLAIPRINVIGLTPENYGRDNDVVRHELNHLVMRWCGLDVWLAQYADDPEGMEEWLCKNMTLFWAIPQPYVDSVYETHGETVAAVVELSRVAQCGLDLALRRFVHDSPHMPRAGFHLKHGRVAQVEVNGFRLPFWLHDEVYSEKLESKFPDVRLTLHRPARGHVIGLVAP